MKQTIAAIVPAYNEEKRIRNVLKVLTNSKFFTEVVCINDGSTDKTKEIIQDFPTVKLIDLAKNKGKANAVVEGIRAATSDLIMFIDADLKGLNTKVFESLAEPLLSGQYDVTIGYPSKVEDITLFRPLTGERCYFRKDLMPHLSALRNKKYGLELALNYLFRNHRIKIVFMKKVSQLHKASKYSSGVALRREWQTWSQLVGEVARQDNPFTFAYGAYLKNYYIRQNDEAKEREASKSFFSFK